MNNIWANRLIAGTRIWAEVPEARKKAVAEILREKLSEEEYNQIING